MDISTETQLDKDRLRENITNLKKVWDPEPAPYVEYSKYGRTDMRIWNTLEQEAIKLNISDYNNLQELLINILKRSQIIKDELRKINRTIGGSIEKEIEDEIWFFSLTEGITSHIGISIQYLQFRDSREKLLGLAIES